MECFNVCIYTNIYKSNLNHNNHKYMVWLVVYRYAAKQHEFPMFKKIYETGKFDVNFQTKNGLSPLHVTCWRPMPINEAAAKDEIENGNKILDLLLSDPKINVNLAAEHVCYLLLY